MKRIISMIIAFALIAAICFSFVACDNSADVSTSVEEEKPTFTVKFAEDDEKYDVIGDNPVTVTQGCEATFTLYMKNDYCIDRVVRKGSAVDARITNGYDGFTTVTVENIRYSMTVDADCIIAAAYISYHINGGAYLDESDASVPYTVGHALKSRLRPNTEIGNDRIYRDGYTLSGWNTSPDGSGEHVGLGSRVTVEKGKTLDLFAEWEKWADKADFDYRVVGGDEGGTQTIAVSRYKGGDKKAVIPAVIDGLIVDRVEFGAFVGDVEKVVLPYTIESVAKGAFYRCNVKEVYFYDNVKTFRDDAFIECPEFSAVHINAILKPRYGKGNLYSEINLADKYDILILNKDKKKLLVFGGSGAYMSVDTNILQETLKTDANADYVCINMAVNGWFCGAAQFEMMMAYMGAGDVFVHAPETSSQYSFMYSVTMTPGGEVFDYNRLRFYGCVESNYDLFSLVDMRHVTDFFNGFTEFNLTRADMEEKSYTDFKTDINLYGVQCHNDLAYIDMRGNFSLPQYPRGAKLDAGEADIVPEYVTDVNARITLKSYYKQMRDMGVKAYFLPAPINKDSLEMRIYHPEKLSDKNFLYSGRPPEIPFEYKDWDTWINDFNTAVATYIQSNYCDVLYYINDVMFVTDDMFDSDYHLCDDKVPVYTGLIADAIAYRSNKNK